MGATPALYNELFNGGLSGFVSSNTPRVELYSGSVLQSNFGGNSPYISGFNAVFAIDGVSYATGTNRVVIYGGASGVGYDELRVLNDALDTIYYSLSISPSQYIAPGDSHNILITLSGVDQDLTWS